MSTINGQFARLTKLVEDMSGDSGALLYGERFTLKRGPLYLLGTNPGGREGPSLKDQLRQDVNAYLDEQWSWRGHLCEQGKHPLQRRVIALLGSLGLQPRDVCAANLIFKRTQKTTGLEI